MAYTINANAKNVWIRDNEDTRDLSIQTDASSVYLDNGRTLEQELGEGSMVSNVVTVDSSMSKVIDGTYDGAYESCVFKGKSLVNLMTKCKDEYVVRYHDPSNPNYTVANISMMKPNTEYTLFYKAKYRLEGEGAGESGNLFIATSVEQGFIGTSQKLTAEYKQYVFKLTTTSTVDCFTFKSNGSYFAIKECVLLEGDYTNQDVPFFEGLCDVKMPILRNVGKNLFDINDNFELGYIDEAGEISLPNRSNSFERKNNGFSVNVTSSYGGVVSSYITVKPNTSYKINFNKIGSFATQANIIFFDNNKNVIKNIMDNRLVNSFTTPSSCSYLRIGFWLFNVPNTIVYENIQLEEGSTATAYEDHKSNILHTSEEIVLREVGGVCDTYNVLTGEYVQRIGETIFDGSDDEGWRFQSINGYGIANFLANAPFKDIPKILCNSLVEQTTLIAETTTEGIYMQNNQSVYVRILSSKASTVALFKAYLQSNPITVQYELAEPVITIIEPSTVPFAYENGHIILESGHEGQSLLPTLEYSTVVNRTGQVESVAKTIQTQEKQLTMLEQMLIQNIIGLDYNNTVLALNLKINEVM